jgi:alcohol dehydrogenase class IV
MVANINIPSTMIVGAGAVQHLAGCVQRLGAHRALLVTDSFLMSNGTAQRVIDHLQENNIEVSVFAEVQPDPTIQNVESGLEVLQSSEADLIIALGGGSPIDAAKAIAVLATNPAPLRQYMGYHKIPRAGVPLIAIPTTAGTGSEVTKVTVITDSIRNVKMMMLDAHLLPTAALVDYQLTMTMPPSLTAHVGVDTLTHGIEAYVSRKANSITDPMALSCIQLVAQYLYSAWQQPDNHAARAAMSIAATQGGMAFSNSSVCLVHGMSRPLGALYHIPHGLSNASLLPVVTRFSISGAPARYAVIARTMGYASAADQDETAAEALVSGLEGLNEKLCVPRLRDCVKVERETYESSLEKMANDALESGSPHNNPVVPTIEQICALYREAW